MEKNSNWPVYLMATCTVICWGSSFAGAKIALQQATPLMVAFLRFVGALVLLLPAAAFMKQLYLPTKKQALVLAAMGFMGFTFHIGIQTVAMESAGSAAANWQMATAPALSALLASVFLKEKMPRSGLWGLLCAFLGVAVVLGLGTKGAKGFESYRFGDFLISISVLNWAAFMVLTRYLFKGDGYPPVFTIFWEMLFAALLYLPILFVHGEHISEILTYNATTWGAIAGLGLLCSGLAYIFWYSAAARLPIARLMAFQFMQPLIGVVVAYFAVGERFTLWLLLGGVMIISGVWCVNRR